MRSDPERGDVGLATQTFRVGDALDAPLDLLFEDVVDVFVVGLETFVVDRGSRSIKVLDERGRLVRTLLGAGEGPGEAIALAGARPVDDSLVIAYDLRWPRITTLSLEGDVQSTVQVTANGASRSDRLLGVLASGAVLTSNLKYGNVVEGIMTDEVHVWRVSPDGQSADPLLVLSGLRRYPVERRGIEVGLTHPLSGLAYIDVYEDSIFASDGFEDIKIFTGDGGFVRSIALPPPTSSYENALTAIFGLLGDSLETEPADAPTLPTPPSISGLMVDSEGRVWIRRFEASLHSPWLGDPGGGDWLMMTRQGVSLSQFSLPGGFRPTAVSGSAMVGTFTDALGVETVAKFSLEFAN